MKDNTEEIWTILTQGMYNVAIFCMIGSQFNYRCLLNVQYSCYYGDMHAALLFYQLSGWIKAWFIHSIIWHIQLSGMALEQGVRIIEVSSTL